MNNQFESKVTFCYNLEKDLQTIIDVYKNEKIFTLVDENTLKHCLPKLPILKETIIIQSKSGERNKTIENVIEIWKTLNKKKATRKSLFINLGGGLLCDIGGFAALTFKRGMDFINIPTTLLAQVDASVGGKTGINFLHYKNEIGVINLPKDVLISPVFFESLDDDNLNSGFAEMIKHALLDAEEHFNELKNLSLRNLNNESFLGLIEKSVSVKESFVRKDPYEKNIRKSLNLGHTFGHAFESFAQKTNKKILHGHCVALGLIPELHLATKKCNFPKDKFEFIINYILSKYDSFQFQESDIESLIEFMKHDKKNEGNQILITLLQDFGVPQINQNCSIEEIRESLTYYLQLIY